MPEIRALNLSRSLLAIAALAAVGTSAQAQSLQALYEAAHAYDATYLGARATAESAQGRAIQADSALKPSLGLGVTDTYTRTKLPSAAGMPDYGNNTLSAGLTGKYAVYNPANRLTAEQAQRNLEVAAADLSVAEQDLIVRLATAYFDVLAAQDALSTARQAKAAITEQLASAKRNFEVGTATITDTREAQARSDLATAQEIAADNDLRSKQVTLDQLVGRRGVMPRPLAVPVALPAVLPVNADAWVSTAVEGHPLIRKARLGLDVARLETKKARAVDGVTVDLNGTLGAQRVNSSLNYGSPQADALNGEGTAKSASLGVTITYPLYTGGYARGRVAEAMSLEEKAQTDVDFAVRGVEEGTRRAFLGVQSLKAQVLALEAAESSSQLALDATKLGYKVGVRVNLDVLNAQTQLYTTQRDLAKARYDVLVNSLKLRQASGQLQPTDVMAINQLLAP
ncbi:TolC family outer membrane protein [Paucibacter sp. R3-3]|uniref:TolC family outer membrane protein n=1 Tax=Roseateles agri TaxID=3098619 RepID=A0ABU5DG99_9BURK|nr:TolC family outer membrane protein [Paucibacter sp. R3-3]MDY0745318.1 TolC family outer membrane protein [Paucibacter sp. R3-3]